MVKIYKDKDQVETSFSSVSSIEHIEDSLSVAQAQTIENIIDKLPKQRELIKKARSITVYSLVRCCKWSKVQTECFYDMLALYGTDFSLMCHSAVFQGKRSKKQLLNKYKKQSKNNSSKIDQTLSSKATKAMFSTQNSQQNSIQVVQEQKQV